MRPLKKIGIFSVASSKGGRFLTKTKFQRELVSNKHPIARGDRLSYREGIL
jgi:hypothetical protein